MDALNKIKQQVTSNPVIIYMKGTPQLPQCGFSSRASQALQQCGREFAYVNVLLDPEVFQTLPQYADWPTFPQLYISGELVGGCDIIMELLQNGELQKMVDGAASEQSA